MPVLVDLTVFFAAKPLDVEANDRDRVELSVVELPSAFAARRLVHNRRQSPAFFGDVGEFRRDGDPDDAPVSRRKSARRRPLDQLEPGVEFEPDARIPADNIEFASGASGVKIENAPSVDNFGAEIDRNDVNFAVVVQAESQNGGFGDDLFDSGRVDDFAVAAAHRGGSFRVKIGERGEKGKRKKGALDVFLGALINILTKSAKPSASAAASRRFRRGGRGVG